LVARADRAGATSQGESSAVAVASQLHPAAAWLNAAGAATDPRLAVDESQSH
jgi:hypothetical protein